jgi:predicted lipid carrier protein YhbT
MAHNLLSTNEGGRMSDIIESFFEQLAAQGYFPRLHAISGSCRCNIEGAGSWTLSIKEGALTITKNSSDAQVDCVITCSKDDCIRMMQCQQHPLTAFMQGRITVTGSVGLAQICMRRLRARPENVQPQAAVGGRQL